MELKEIKEIVVSLLRLTEKGTKILEGAVESPASNAAGFRSWYNGPEGRFAKYVVSGLVLLSFADIASSIARQFVHIHWMSVEHVRETIYIAESAVIILVALNIVLFPRFKPFTAVDRDLSADPDLLKSASESSERFLNYWLVLWFSWFALYIWLTIVAAGVLSDQSIFVRAFTNACNNASAVMIFSLYYEMAERTDSRKPGMLFVPTSMVLLALFAGELILANSLPDLTQQVFLVFSLVSGLTVGVATALLSTKLATRFFNLPIWAIAFMTVYAVIQPVFPIIARPGDSENAATSVVSLVIAMIAFYGKVFLLSVVHWARDDGQLFYYMIRARRIYDEEADPRLRAALISTANKLQHPQLSEVSPKDPTTVSLEL